MHVYLSVCVCMRASARTQVQHVLVELLCSLVSDAMSEKRNKRIALKVRE